MAAFSRGIFDAKRQQRIVRWQRILPSRGADGTPSDAARRYPVLVVAALYAAANEDLDFLLDYARAGGHLVLGPRTGYGDEEGRARTERAPARLGEAAGVWYDETASLRSPVPLDGAGLAGAGLAGTGLAGAGLAGAATGLAEGLVAVDAEVLATYRHPHLGRWAAVTTKPVGSGRITVVGTIPDQDLAAALSRWLAPQPTGGWTTDDSVTASTGTDRAGRRLHVLHNWSWQPASAKAEVPLTDLLTDGTHAAGERVNLGPWDVRIFRGSVS